MMKAIATIIICYAILVGVSVSQSQQTPSQILLSGKDFQALSPYELELSKAYLLSLLVYGASTSPTLILSNGASFYGMSPNDLSVAQAYLLAQIQASGIAGGSSVSNLNGLATNLTQYFTANTTNYLNTGTVYWVWNGGIPVFSVSSAGGYVFYNGVIGDGSGLTNLTPTAVAGAITNGNTFNVQLGGGTWKFGNNLTLTNSGGILALTNVAGTGRGTVAAAANGDGVALKGALAVEYLSASTLGVLVSNSVPFRVDDGGNVTISNGTVVASLGLNTRFMLGYVDSLTNSWTTNTALPLGVTNLLATLSANVNGGITGLTGAGTVNDERWGRLNIVATGNVTFTNPASFRSSDFVTSRIITNGNSCEIVVTWQQGVYTNMLIHQFK